MKSMHQMQSPLHFICEVSAYAKYTSKCSANIYSLWRIMPRPYLRMNSSSRGCKSSAKIRLIIYIFTMLFTLFYLGIKYVVYVPTKPSILCSGCTSQEKNVPSIDWGDSYSAQPHPLSPPQLCQANQNHQQDKNSMWMNATP